MIQYLQPAFKPDQFYASGRFMMESSGNDKGRLQSNDSINSTSDYLNRARSIQNPYQTVGIPKDYAQIDRGDVDFSIENNYKTDAVGGFGAGRNVPGNEDPNSPLGHSDFTGYGEFDYNLEDTDWKTSPINPFATWRHFRDIDDVEEDLLRDLQSGNREDFARHMHQGQDYYVHYSKGYRWYTLGHAFNPNADNDEAAWNKAEQWTQNVYNQWIDKWGATNPKDYMLPEVLAQNDTQGASAKSVLTGDNTLKKDDIHVNQNEGDPDAVNGDCGPASVLMAIRLAGGQVEGETTVDQLTNVRKMMYLNNSEMDGINDQGLRDDDEHDRWTSMSAMRTGLNVLGTNHHNVAPKIDDISEEIQNGNSVILAGKNHFMVVGGYDEQIGAFTIYDPAADTPLEYSVDDLESFMYDDVYGIAVEPYVADTDDAAMAMAA